MTSLLFDTNALVYWVYSASPFHKEVSALARAAFKSDCPAYVLASSLNEVYCALHRHYTTESVARDSIRDIAETFDLIDLTGLFVFEAIDSDESDYEDGLIRVAAEELQVDAIISYDKAAFKSFFVPKMTAAEAYEDFFQKPENPKD